MFNYEWKPTLSLEHHAAAAAAAAVAASSRLIDFVADLAKHEDISDVRLCRAPASAFHAAANNFRFN